MSRFARLSAAVLLALLLVIAGTAVSLIRYQRVYPGVSVSGVDLGGLTISEAESRLQLTADREAARPFAFLESRCNFLTINL